MSDHWLDANVISINRNKGPKTYTNNYRSISLDTIEKLFAGIVCNRPSQLTDNRLPLTESGFRRHLATKHETKTIRHIIQRTLNTNQVLVLTFIKLNKEFDTLPK